MCFFPRSINNNHLATALGHVGPVVIRVFVFIALSTQCRATTRFALENARGALGAVHELSAVGAQSGMSAAQPEVTEGTSSEVFGTFLGTRFGPSLALHGSTGGT